MDGESEDRSESPKVQVTSQGAGTSTNRISSGKEKQERPASSKDESESKSEDAKEETSTEDKPEREITGTEEGEQLPESTDTPDIEKVDESAAGDKDVSEKTEDDGKPEEKSDVGDKTEDGGKSEEKSDAVDGTKNEDEPNADESANKSEKPDTEGETPKTENEVPGDTAENEDVLASGDSPDLDKTGDSPDDGEENINENAVTEGEETAEQKEEEPEEVLIPEDFYYDYEEFVSRPVVTEDSGLPSDMIALKHSFGYDCTKRCNLFMLDETTVMFCAGNMVQLVDLQTKEQKYIRSMSGGGIGALAVHPSRQYFAVGEKGDVPNINIFGYPSMKLYRILRAGTEQSYASLTFSPDGKLLASQGGNPDFMLTVWNWQQEKIVLRSKAFSQDVFRVTFSTELEGQLTTAGTVHIRFWKMADTFTGLKLQGELGKFGKTELSDIEGYVELPDGKVLSGCEWGNMIVWDGGLIKVEISRKNKKSCHVGPIQQILLDEGELMTIGVDGYIRVWDFETIDTAEISDEGCTYEMEPMNELRVGYDVQLKAILKSVDAENEPTIWYAQDANGGIWKLDLSFSHTSQSPEKMFTYHAGPIAGCDVSPKSHLVATTGTDQTVRVFDCIQNRQLVQNKYNSGGSCVLWAPSEVDKHSGTLIVGFEDGVVRILTVKEPTDSRKKSKQDCEISLVQAVKPHTKLVTSVAIDPSGKFLASGGDDASVFFMEIGETCDPIGFMKTPAPVKHIQWSPANFEKKTLLVTCDEGFVVEFNLPDPEKVDSSHTYQIKEFTCRTYQFSSIKSQLRHDEELERKRIEEEARKKREAEERQKRIDRGLETESDKAEEEDTKPAVEEEWRPYVPTDKSPILSTMFSQQEGQFWLSMDEYDAGYLYECKFVSETTKETTPESERDKPLRAIPVLQSNDEPVTMMKYSPNGKQVIFGMKNGAIRVQQLETEYDISSMNEFWVLSMHDNNYGHITGLSFTFDGLMLLTVGSDGNFFQYSYMPQEQIDKKIADSKARIPSSKKISEDVKPPDDIDDPNAYSIEDAKQKAEYDKMMKEAEEKKREVRRQIAKLRRTFKSLLEQNEGLPNHLQLKHEEFEMDREIKLELEKQTQDKIAEVRKQLAWESEKHRIALEKIRKRFKDTVECERIVVKAFNTTHEVSSFRAGKLSEDFYSLRADFERRRTIMMSREDLTRDPTRNLLTGQTRESESGTVVDKTDETDGQKIFTSLKGSMGERISKALTKVEEKKKKRQARRIQWEELNDSKPDDHYEDPADVSAIKEAKENMGDFKLKTADDYVVPDHLRMNVEKARGRLLLLKDLIHEHKYEFNTRLITLRDRKIKVIEKIKDHVTRLEEVQSRLSPDKCKPIPKVPEMCDEEMPERQLEYTKETLTEFRKELAAKEQALKHGDSTTQGLGGFGGGGGAKAPSIQGLTQKQSSTLSNISKDPTVDKPKEGDIFDEEVQLSPLELRLQHAEEIRNIYERDRLLKEIEKLLNNFDAELRLLRHDKFKMDIVMKNADLRQVTLFEEFVLLKEYEKRENVLAAKVTSKQQEKLDMQAKLLDCQMKLDSKKKEIEKLLEKEKALLAQFQQSLGENNKFADYLTKVFKKRIKRAKKKVTEGDGSDDDSESDSDDESDLDESDEESESELGGYDLDVCPSGCDQTIYDTTCQLREKRLDIEEEMTEEKKINESLKKEAENITKKTKVIESGLKTAQNDLEAFQLEKQQKLNELDVVVTVRLHQIQHMVNGVLPQDLSQTLVFEANGVNKLQNRIKELEHEKILQKKQMKEAKRKHVQLIKDRKLFDHKIAELDDQCNQMMIGKFGRIVDLEKLETVTVNRQIEELKEKLRLCEIQCAEDVTEWNEVIRAKKEKITVLIKENTDRLDQLCMLLGERKTLEGSLDSRQKSLGEEYSGQRKSDVREKQRLIQLVQLQAQEIDALKEEIMLLSRKGGHILPPAQPPLPASPHNLPV